jgi:hypothetical protein
MKVVSVFVRFRAPSSRNSEMGDVVYLKSTANLNYRPSVDVTDMLHPRTYFS